MNRGLKRFAIVLIFFLILLMFFLVFYFALKKDPTCSDGIQNQREDNIDCGGPCLPCEVEIVPEDLVILKQEWVYDIDNKYDIVTKIKNPNGVLGAKSIKYRIILLGNNREEIASSEILNDFILPGEEKYLFAQSVISSSAPNNVELKIESVEWVELSQLDEPRFSVIRKNYQVLSSGSPNFSQLIGALINKSNNDFEEIKIKILLRDESGKLLATNYQIANTIRAEEEREFLITFHHNFPGSVVNIEVKPETNIFDPDNRS